MSENEEETAELAAKAREAWNDPEIAALREEHVNYDNDQQIIAWAYHWGLLP
jgi:hypothetical protein